VLTQVMPPICYVDTTFTAVVVTKHFLNTHKPIKYFNHQWQYQWKILLLDHKIDRRDTALRRKTTVPRPHQKLCKTQDWNNHGISPHGTY
jgi:hypothetical protein